MLAIQSLSKCLARPLFRVSILSAVIKPLSITETRHIASVSAGALERNTGEEWESMAHVQNLGRHGTAPRVWVWLDLRQVYRFH